MEILRKNNKEMLEIKNTDIKNISDGLIYKHDTFKARIKAPKDIYVSRKFSNWNAKRSKYLKQ